MTPDQEEIMRKLEKIESEIGKNHMAAFIMFWCLVLTIFITSCYSK